MRETAHPLTHRDLSVLEFVFTCDGVAIEHVRQMFFPTSGARTSCYRRVDYLVRNEYLRATRLPSLTGVGSGPLFLTLGPKGKGSLAQVFDVLRSRLSRIRSSSPLFIAHHLAICDAYVAFQLACQASPRFKLREWVTDRELHRAPLRVNDPRRGEEIVSVADALFVLSLLEQNDQSFVLEVDMGTVASKRMVEKLRGYLLRAGEATPVLFVVPDRPRQSAIVRWTLQEAADLGADPTAVWIATREAIRPEKVLSEPIWQVAGGPDSVSMEELAGAPPERSTGQIVFTARSNGHGGLAS